MPALPKLGAALAAAALLVALAACQTEPPAERVAAVRAGYEAQLNSFQVRETPLAPPSAAGPENGDEPEAAPGTAPGVEPTPEPPEALAPLPDETAVERDVLLDIVLRNRGEETLPGITLDVEQVDAQERPKTSYKIYVDASGAHPGGQAAQVAHVLEDVDFAPGDGFSVEVRHPVPPEAWGDYRELAEADEGSAP